MNMFEILTSVYGGIVFDQNGPSQPAQAGGVRSGTVHRGLQWIRKAARRTVAAFREHAYARDLARLDDRMLRDIGISRSDIPYVAHTYAQAAPGNDNAPRLAA